MRYPWTPEGIQRLHESLSELRDTVAAGIQEQTGLKGPLRETSPQDENLTCAASRLAHKLRLLENIYIAPKPTQFERVQVNHLVEIEYLEASVRKSRGDHEQFILGGPNENDLDSVTRTYSCESPLGRAVVNRSVGTQLLVRGGKGNDYEIVIVSISAVPASDHEKTAAST